MLLTPPPETQVLWKLFPSSPDTCSPPQCLPLPPEHHPTVNLGRLCKMEDSSSELQRFGFQGPAFTRFLSTALQQEHLAAGDFLNNSKSQQRLPPRHLCPAARVYCSRSWGLLHCPLLSGQLQLCSLWFPMYSLWPLKFMTRMSIEHKRANSLGRQNAICEVRKAASP